MRTRRLDQSGLALAHVRLTLARLFAASACAAAAGSLADAQSRVLQFYGAAYGWQLGVGLGTTGDIDLDGVNDFILGEANMGRFAIHSGRTGTVIVDYPVGGGTFARDVDGAGDVNGDGIPDVIVGAPGWSALGNAWVFSTAGPTIIQSVQGPGNSEFGIRVRHAGDVNSDGHSDYLVGARGGKGSVSLFSGATGTASFAVFGDDFSDHAGVRLDSAGDSDGDGWADVLIGVEAVANYAKLVSGRTGALIRQYVSPVSGSLSFGMAVANAGDVNADGVPDAIISDKKYPSTIGTGLVHVFSGATGELLMTGAGDVPNLYLGHEVLGPGDLDGDGYDDVVAGTYYAAFFPGGDGTKHYLRAWSGRTHSVLWDKKGNASGIYPYIGAGYELAATGDLNADGTPDFLSTSLNGFVTLFSGKQLSLEPDNTMMTVSGGGLVSLRSNVGASYAGDFYLIAGTTSGTSPGLAVGNVLVPLNFDAYTSFTVATPNNAPLSGSLGVLSSSGIGFSQFTLPPFTSQSLAGTTVHHVGLTIDANGVGTATNPVILSLLP